MGLTFNNAETALRVRRVMRIAVLMSCLALINFIVYADTSPGDYYYGGIVFALAIPACGYFGAANRDRNLLCCFCGCSALAALSNLMVAIFLIIYVSDLDDDFQDDSFQQPDTAVVQFGVTGSGADVLVATQIIVVLLYCCGFVQGNRLYEDKNMYVTTVASRNAAAYQPVVVVNNNTTTYAQQAPPQAAYAPPQQQQPQYQGAPQYQPQYQPAYQPQYQPAYQPQYQPQYQQAPAPYQQPAPQYHASASSGYQPTAPPASAKNELPPPS